MSDLAAVRADLAPSGRLRAAINLGNPVLAQGSGSAPGGVTVDLAGELAARLSVALELLCFDAARKSLQAMVDDDAQLCFLAVDPARAADVAFTRPYVVIEGCYVVPADSDLSAVGDVDRPGIRVGVKQGSAYDLHLSRTLGHATVVRGVDGTTVFDDEGLEVGAGIREPLTAYVAQRPDRRLLDGAFMQIRQAVGVSTAASPETLAWLDTTLADLLATGFVTDSLRRSGQSPSLAAT